MLPEQINRDCQNENGIMSVWRIGQLMRLRGGLMQCLMSHHPMAYVNQRPQTLTGPAWREAWAKANPNHAVKS